MYGLSPRFSCHVVGLDARIGERDLLRQRIAGQQRLRHRQAGATQRRDRCGALQKLAPVDATVAVLVVQVEYALVDFALCDALKHVMRSGLLFAQRDFPPCRGCGPAEDHSMGRSGRASL
jgi:hypothetical protein